MSTKIVFIGNMLGGDDGIGPFLYNELKDDPDLKDFELLELGVIGFDLISYVEYDDKLIIVDAVHSENNVGEVILIDENDLSQELSLVSQHDFGVEQTAAILRAYAKDLKRIVVVGIKVKQTNAFTDKLSDELMNKMQTIRAEVVDLIIQAATEG
ncbi:MAG: hydrogenase maturation protease [Methanosarcinales archaeon]|nr:hydrogenase maturation protease [ANME-2 cluster archaeon]MDF1531054.1 hydrogenase maturation protease [ANME-2 cluster archaeon]MDW7775509.1 hydrogenase maturation protease [Methanosarcinales archaeon]